MIFHSPWYFVFLLVLPWLLWRFWSRPAPLAIQFSSLRILRQLRPTLRQRLMWLPFACLLLSIAIAIFAIAQPRQGRDQTITTTEGIAMAIVCDRSGSMQAMDFKVDGKNVDRLSAIKNVVSKFVLGNDQELKGRISDLIGLVTFAGFADGETPLTLDHRYLVTELQRTEIVDNRSEDGTAIGDALALAVEKLTALDAKHQQKVKSKIIILLTDGENNAGESDPVQASELAETMGIKVYTIGVGTKGQAPVPVIDPFSGRRMIQWMPVNIDEETLEKIANITGGKYFRATDTESLAKIYTEIDRLEKTEVETKQFTNYRELAVQSYPLAGVELPGWLWLAFGLMTLKVILENTWLRETIA